MRVTAVRTLISGLLTIGLIATGSPVAASGPAPDRSTAKFEIGFLTGMIDHHHMAVEMADMCLDRAVHPELRSLCNEIIAAQSAEIEEMHAWLQDWYGMSHDPVMKGGEMRAMEKLSALSGAEFEITFMEMMIKHHRAAIGEAERCLDRASHDELLSMCADIITSQSAEIEQMRDWLCDWYDRCAHASGRKAKPEVV